MRRLRTALLRRRGPRWRVDVAVRRPPRRTWLRPLVEPRRELRATPLATTLALRRERTVFRSRSWSRSRLTQLVTTITVAPVSHRSTVAVHLEGGGAHLVGAAAPRVESPRERPLERAHLLTRTLRELVLRHTRIETTAGAVPPAAAPGDPERRPTPPVPPPLVLRSHTRSAAPMPGDTAPSVFGAELPAVPETTLVAAPQPQLPSVDHLAAQVLDHIERRAIAQRERLGRI
jgi:hypothetical protein